MNTEIWPVRFGGSAFAAAGLSASSGRVGSFLVSAALGAVSLAALTPLAGCSFGLAVSVLDGSVVGDLASSTCGMSCCFGALALDSAVAASGLASSDLTSTDLTSTDLASTDLASAFTLAAI